jgi:hypothetical protein
MYLKNSKRVPKSVIALREASEVQDPWRTLGSEKLLRLLLYFLSIPLEEQGG